MFNNRLSIIKGDEVVIDSAGSNFFNVKDFGAIGDGVNDDTLPIQKAISKALHVRGCVYIPNGKYRITATLNCIPIWGKDAGPNLGPNGGTLNDSGCSIVGEHVTGTIIFPDFDNWQTINIKGEDVCQYYLPDGTLKPIQESYYGQPKNLIDKIVFYYADHMKFSDMWVIKKDKGINPEGIAFSTPCNTQCGWGVFERVNIELFNYGIWNRYTLYSSFKDMTIQNCRVGIRFARVDDRYPQKDNRNPPAVENWNNWLGGWYHNVVTFNNCSIKGNAYPDSLKIIKPGVSEVGFWGCPMSTVFTACTCEDIYRHKEAKNNIIAPKGMPGTGMFIEDGRGFNEGKGITIDQLYTEVTERPIYAMNTRDLNINSGFMQGAYNPLSATNSVFEFRKCRPVNIRGNIIIPGFFKYFIEAKENSKIIYDDVTDGFRWGGNFYKDYSSNIVKRNF